MHKRLLIAGGMGVSLLLLLLLIPQTSTPGVTEPAVPPPDTTPSDTTPSDETLMQSLSTTAPRPSQSSYGPVPAQSPQLATTYSSSRMQANPDPEDERMIVTPDGKRYPLRVYEPLTVPNDPYARQWWTAATGMEQAWSYPAGSYQTSVAVIDSGFALEHEEFTGRWLLNDAERGTTLSEAASRLNCTDQGLPLDKSCNNIDDDFDTIVDNESGLTAEENPSTLNCTDQGLPLDKSCNNIDDDGNGFIDDLRGWDFANYDARAQAGEVNPQGDGTTHGTMVSSVLAANANNGRGTSGVNWSTKILPLQALTDDSYGDTLTVGRAIYYAADRDVDVISISLGASAQDLYLREAIAYALDKGSIVVAASGNDGCNCINYPANYPEVVAVGAMAPDGSKASFSNYGAQLDIMAPGEDMITATWQPTAPTSSYVGGAAGTSFSTPYVSGLLAMARSHQPQASWGELLAALTEESDHRTQTATAPHSSTNGYGYARAGALMSRVTSSATPALRYQFGPIESTDTLDSARVYQCADSRIPTTRLYALSRGTEITYTASPLTLSRAVLAGWTTKPVAYVCAGLPIDAPETIRTINLRREINAF